MDIQSMSHIGVWLKSSTILIKVQAKIVFKSQKVKA